MSCYPAAAPLVWRVVAAVAEREGSGPFVGIVKRTADQALSSVD